jgi:hypothetical protein
MPFTYRGSDGRTYTVCSEVGDGLTKFPAQAQQQQEEPQSLEQSGDEAGATS